jgi:protein-S-isoprenylcysteine O-methyltransferase Ste14
VAIISVILTLGFWAPWIELWGIGNRFPLWAWLALQMCRTGMVSCAAAAPLVIVVVALIAAKGAALRIWGTAYLGSATVNHGEMKAGAVLSDGPYRYVRNPLYLGSWCMFAAMAFLMPVSGALFAMVLLTAFLLRLILAEEAFLTSQRGEPYLSYMRTVPRLFPRLRNGPASTAPQPTGRKPQWLHALITEINPIGIFVALAFFSWSYNNWLMIKVVIFSFGLSMIVRAFVPRDSAK